MGSKRNSELRRLEEALMEEEDLVFDFSQASSAKSRQANSTPVCKAVNTDRTDVDMDAYSEDVHRGKSGGVWGVLLTMGCMLLLAAGILLLLKFLGVL
jgi:hypothetical protein